MMRKFLVLIFVLLLSPVEGMAQGKNYNWLIGYNVALDTSATSTKARIIIDSSSVFVLPEIRKLAFNSAQSNISDENGNLIISTNGCWIANSNGDTILNGSNLTPSPFSTSWCSSHSGIPYPHANIILPWPGDTTKYILFHQTSDDPNNYRSNSLYYTVINITLDSGRGGVDSSQKNILVFQDKLNIGVSACQHANGRDWWIIVQRDSSDVLFKILLTAIGISNISSQSMGVPIAQVQNGQPLFSSDGNKFAYSTFSGPINSAYHDVRIMDFDRCSGQFSNPLIVNVTDSSIGTWLIF